MRPNDDKVIGGEVCLKVQASYHCLLNPNKCSVVSEGGLVAAWFQILGLFLILWVMVEPVAPVAKQPWMHYGISCDLTDDNPFYGDILDERMLNTTLRR